MPGVILDGPGAGMTQGEYDEMRKLDCLVAIYLGWIPVFNGENPTAPWLCKYWKQGVNDNVRLRDDADFGVPFYQLDANAALLALKHACSWRYAGQRIFFRYLQEAACFDKGDRSTTVAYPDVLVSLSSDFPKYICTAFVECNVFFEMSKFDPYKASVEATNYAGRSTKETIVETDENGTEHHRLKVTPPDSFIPPWVKLTPIKEKQDA